MRYLTLEHLLDLHRLVIAQSGGAKELRDINALESAAFDSNRTLVWPLGIESPKLLSSFLNSAGVLLPWL